MSNPFGKVKSGFHAIPEDLKRRSLDINSLLIRNPASSYFMRVADSDMESAGIMKDDIVLVDRSLEPSDGRLVVYSDDAGNFSIRFVKASATGLRLVDGAGRTYLFEETYQLWGPVVAVVRSFY